MKSAQTPQRRTDILALLEERAYATQELAELLQLPNGMHQVCIAMAREGLIVRVSPSGPWMLPTASAADLELARPFQQTCPLCKGPFVPRSNRQRICVECRIKAPHRAVEEMRRGPAAPGKGWKERPCEGCQKPILSNGPKVRCPDCLLALSRERLRTKLDERRRREEETTERLLAIEESAPVGNAVCERCGQRFTRRDGTSGRFCSRTCYERGRVPAATSHTIDGVDFEVISNCNEPVTADWPDSGRGGSSLAGLEFPYQKS